MKNCIFHCWVILFWNVKEHPFARNSRVPNLLCGDGVVLCSGEGFKP